MDKIKILALEDEQFHKITFFNWLKRLYDDIDFTMVSTCREAIKKYDQHRYDIIYVDLLLQGQIEQGSDLIKYIREKNKDIIIHIVSAMENESIYDEKEFSKKYRINRWLKKPLYFKDYYTYIKKDLGNNIK